MTLISKKGYDMEGNFGVCWLFLATKKNTSNQVNSFIQKDPYWHFHANAKYISIRDNKRNT